MKALLVAVVACCALAPSAKAADMPIKAPARVVDWNWSGFYVGGHVGGGAAKTDATTLQSPPGTNTALLQPFDLKGASVLGGFHAGYNWQVTPAWLIGIEGDFDWTRMNDSASTSLTATTAPPPGLTSSDTVSRNLEWLASVRGRLGYTAGNWLIYATGGAAWGKLQLSAIQTVSFLGVTGTFSFSDSTTRSGWVAGGGVEHAFDKNWILRAEYLYYSLSGETGIAMPPGSATSFIDTFGHTMIHTGRVGISYKFPPL